MPKLASVLEFPFSYRLFSDLISGNARETYVREYVRAQPGERVLDIGCGTADILKYLPPVDYQGFDLNAAYIKCAQQSHSSRGVFYCEDVSKAVLADPGTFDVVMANGVLHHLNDEAARCLLRLAYQALKPSGRLCFIDPCFLPGQSRIAHFLLRMDRGEFIGSPKRTFGLAQEVFPNVTHHIRQDLLRVPYSHCILTATKAGSESDSALSQSVMSQKV